MKYLFLLFTLVFSLTSFSQSIKYFRSAFENIFTQHIGAYPISKVQSAKLNHYEFTYNEENQLVSIEYFSKYDKASLYSDILHANRLEFQYEENSKQIFSYSADWDGELVMSEEFMDIIYVNNLVKEVSYKYLDGEDQIVSSVLYYNYNSKDKLYSLTGMGDYPYYFRLGGNMHSCVKLNANNQVVEDLSHTFEGDTTILVEENSRISMYDLNGNLVWWKDYDENKGPYYTNYNASSYDNNGYLSGTILYSSEDQRVDYTSTEYIGEDDTLLFSGPCETKWINDDFGNVLSKKTYNKSGEPFEDVYGVFEVVNGVDLINGVFTESYLNAKKQPVESEVGYSFSEIHRDKKGRNTYEKYMDVSKNVLINEIGVAIVKYQYVDSLSIIYESYFDQADQPMTDNSGAHMYERSIDDNYGFYETVYDLEGVYMGTDELYDFRVRSVNLDNYYINESTSYFDMQRFPMLNSENYFQEKNNFDENHNLLSIQYLDSELKTINAIFGDVSYAEIKFKYDENQNQIEKAYFDADGVPSLDENLISVYKTKYDQYGNTLQIDRYNAELALLNSTMSFATVKYKYDSNLMLTEEAFYNAKGELWQDEDGVARYIFEITNGNITKRKFFNSQNKATIHLTGVYQIEYTYDANSNVILVRFLNKKGKKMNNLEGIHTVTYTYNENNLITSVEMRNKKRKLAMADPFEIGFKSARIIYTYDENEEYLDTIFYDVEGKQISFPEQY